MLASDVSMLDRLIADDLVFTAFTGRLATKADDLEMHRSGLIKIESLDVLGREVRILQEVAVVVAHVRLSGLFNNQPAGGEFRFLRVWAMKPDGWQIVAGQCTMMA
jgi:hypothetical protein